MKVAIHQPNFLPWIGYFHKIKSVDCFVFFDNVQFERGKTYTSRTKILVQGKENWLTVPVANKSSLMNIKDIETAEDFSWKSKHLKTLFLNYKKAPFYDEVFPLIENVYSTTSRFLIDYNIPLILDICKYMGINTRFISSSNLVSDNEIGNEKIIKILKELKADEYLSGNGEGSKRYINEMDFINNAITLTWQMYEPVIYKQNNTNEFTKNLSIIDLLFSLGKDSVNLL